MGKLMGGYDLDEDHDIPELNKCPDCQTYFKGDNCPICGKPCPENMRAGNRPVVKAKKQKKGRESYRVTFVPWYHRWWFIILMIILMPLAGMILALTSPHKTYKKVIAAVIAALMLIGRYATPYLENFIFNRPPELVDSKLTEDDYRAKCALISAEELYRNSEAHKNEFVCVKLTVEERLEAYEQFYPIYYRCVSDDGRFTIYIRNCLVNVSQNFVAGDTITVYGEMQGDTNIYLSYDEVITAPALYMAYFTAE